MKLALYRLRLWLVGRVMQAMWCCAHVVQLGHPFGRAPTLRPEPAPEETLGSFEGGKVYGFDNAIVVFEHDGVAITGRNEYFFNLTRYFRGARLHPALVRLNVARAQKLPGTGAYLCTPQATHNYYHWMCDLMPRLWLLEQAGFTPETLDHVFVNGDGSRWQMEPLLTYGFRPEQIRSGRGQERFQVDRLIVPGLVFDEQVFAPWKVNFLRRLYPEKPKVPMRLLFCGRKGAVYRRLLQEDDLFARLEPLGFERMDASQLTVAGQAQLFFEARMIVAIHGAALTNLVFSQPGVQVFEIQSREAPQTFFTSMGTGIGARWQIIAATPERRGTDPVDYNRIDLILSPNEIDALVAEVEKALAS